MDLVAGILEVTLALTTRVKFPSPSLRVRDGNRILVEVTALVTPLECVLACALVCETLIRTALTALNTFFDLECYSELIKNWLYELTFQLDFVVPIDSVLFRCVDVLNCFADFPTSSSATLSQGSVSGGCSVR